MRDAATESEPVALTGKEIRLKRHTAAAKMVLNLFQNHLSDQDQQALYSINFASSLSEEERIVLMWVLLRTFPADIAENIVKTWFEGQGMPGASLTDDPRSEAKFWASDATSRELSSYAAAAFNQMSPKAQANFAEFVNGKVGGK